MGFLDRFRAPQKRHISPDEAGLALAVLIWTSETSEALAAVCKHSPLSETAIRNELLSLRLFAADMGSFLALGGQTQPQIAVLGAVYLFHGFLAEHRGGTVKDVPQKAVELKLNGMIDSFLVQIRNGDPQQYQILTKMKAAAPTIAVVDLRTRAYREMVESDAERTLQNVGGRFATLCQAEYDPIVQLMGAMEFSATLKAVEHFFGSIMLRQAA